MRGRSSSPRSQPAGLRHTREVTSFDRGTITQLGAHGSEFGVVATDEDHMGTQFVETMGRRPTQSGGSAGDDDSLTVEAGDLVPSGFAEPISDIGEAEHHGLVEDVVEARGNHHHRLRDNRQKRYS